jgi:type I restriction enzyme S subunit
MSDFITGSLDDFLSLIESGTRPKGGVNLIGDIPSFGGENVTDQGKIRFYPVKKISRRFFSGMTRGHLQDLDVIINKDGANTGKSTIYRNSPYRCATVNEHLFILRSKSEKLDQVFLHNYFQWSETKREIYQKITGSAQPGLNSTFVDNFPVSFPPLPEQQKIASILTSVDEVIEKTQSQINKLEDLKKATMNELLTRGIGHTEFKDSELGRIPKSWTVKPLSTLSDFVTSGSRGWSQYYSSYGAIFIRIGNLTRRNIYFDWTNVVRVTPPQNGEGTRTKVQKGDILISITADLGIIGVIDSSETDAYVNQHIALVRPRDSYIESSLWIGIYLSGAECQKQFIEKNDAGAKSGLNLETIKRIYVAFPPLQEQSAITKILGSTDCEIREKQLLLIKFKFLKKSLMQDLLTGKIRVTVN